MATTTKLNARSKELEKQWRITQAKHRESERAYKAAEKRYHVTKQQMSQAFADLCNFRSKHGLGRR